MLFRKGQYHAKKNYGRGGGMNEWNWGKNGYENGENLHQKGTEPLKTHISWLSNSKNILLDSMILM